MDFIQRNIRNISNRENTKKMKAIHAGYRVQGFTVEARIGSSNVVGPPSTGVFRDRRYRPTDFRRSYERGDLPVDLNYSKRSHTILWKKDIETLDYHHYLPLFFDGLVETCHPLDVFARKGVCDLLNEGGSRILPVIPRLITPIRNALNTRNNQVMCTTLKVLQHLVMSERMVGRALVPYYRHILPAFNLFKNKKRNCGCDVDSSQRKGESIGDLIEETLKILEINGGRNAFINIKYMIPTYTSYIGGSDSNSSA